MTGPSIPIDPAREQYYHARGLWSDERIGWLLENAAARWGDREFLVIDGHRLGFAGLNRMVEAAATFLIGNGARKGDHILMQSGNCLELIVLQFATWRIGAISVPIVPVYRARELRAIIAEVRPTVVAAARVAGDRHPLREIDGALADCNHAPRLKIMFGSGERVGSWRALSLDRIDTTLPDPAPAGDCCAILFTSGTTAAPKGVMMSGRALLSGLQNWHLNVDIGSDAVACSGAPLTHIGALYAALLIPLFAGARTVLMARWDPDLAVRVIEHERVTFMAGATVFLQDLVERYEAGRSPHYRLPAFTTGGSATPPSLIHRAAAVGITADRSYGMTETCGTISQGGRHLPIAVRADTDGRVAYGSAIEIVDDDDRTLPFGEAGHIRIRSPQLMNGYTDAAATASQCRDGWFYPGDIGTMSSDGYLTMKGRSKDIINRAGEKFSCQDIEAALADHRQVLHAAVIGLPHPRLGESVCACLVLREDEEWTGPADLLDHLERCALARPKIPVDWELFDAFPRTAAGKVQKNRLLEIVMERREKGARGVKALVCDRFGSLDDIRYREVTDPEPGPGEILVAVRAAGVVFADLLFALGKYQVVPPLPFVMGCELAGDVVAIGEGVERFRIGDRVASMAINFGAFAEKVVLPAWLPTPLPADISYQTGAALLSSSGTAQHALRQRAALRPGETLVVTGAAGGTGSAAIQAGKAMGGRVIAACSSPDRADLCRRLGADETIDYSAADLNKSIKALTGGAGADVVFETVGGDIFDACTRAIAFEGRLLTVGFASGRLPMLPANLALVKSYALIGVHWHTFVLRHPDIHRENMTELMAWVETGKVDPVVSATLPMAAGVDALRAMADRRIMGKIVLTP